MNDSLAMNIKYFDRLESTNNYCKLLDLANVGEFTVIVARSQTGGIGQRGNVWVSEPYKNLTFILILKPLFLTASEHYRRTMTLATAMAMTVQQLLPVETVRIKWPNDIYVGDRKICGILTTCNIKSDHITEAICGIGLNVNQEVFPDWVPNPTSLKIVTHRDHNTDEVLSTALANIESQYRLLSEDYDSIEADYLNLMYQRGERHKYDYRGEIIEATIETVNRYGHLQLRTANGTFISCDIKEIRFL